MDKGTRIEEIRPEVPVDGIFVVISKRLLETRNGAPYLALTLGDRTGEIEGRLWERAEDVAGGFGERDYVRVKAEAQLFRNAVQLRVLSVERIEPSGIDPADFMPATRKDIDSLWAELQKAVKGLDDPVLAALLKAIFRDPEISTAFRRAPAAKRMHHAYLGGLLEHTVGVVRLAEAVCRLYPGLDHDLLIAAAILHDLGKIREFSYARPPIEYSDEGRLLGHLVIGAGLIDEFLARLRLADGEGRGTALKHLVLSHHGQREFGSPVLPMTEEALVLHLLDDLDAKLNFTGRLKEDLPGPGSGWTDYQRPLDRYLYLSAPGGNQDAEEGEEQAGEASSRPGPQPSLWSGGK